MAIAHVQTANDNIASANSDTLAYASNVAAGSLLVMCYRIGLTTETVAVSDGVNGSWTNAIKQTLASHGEVGIFYFANAGAGATTVTISFTNATSIRWTIHEYSGAATSSPLDQTATETGADASVGAGDGPDVTTTANGELLVACMGTNGGASVTVGTGWTRREDVPDDPNLRLIVEERLQDIGTYSADFATLFTGSYIITVATFKVAGAVTFYYVGGGLPLIGVQ